MNSHGYKGVAEKCCAVVFIYATNIFLSVFGSIRFDYYHHIISTKKIPKSNDFFLGGPIPSLFSMVSHIYNYVEYADIIQLRYMNMQSYVYRSNRENLMKITTRRRGATTKIEI